MPSYEAVTYHVSSLLISALNMILAGFSQTYVFVLGVYYKLQTFLYLPANGVIQGMQPLIGYNYGAGEKKRVHQIFLQAAGFVISSLSVTACGALEVLGKGSVARILDYRNDYCRNINVYLPQIFGKIANNELYHCF